MIHISHRIVLLLICASTFSAGCKSKGSGKEGQVTSPERTVELILAEYDTNKDNVLDAKELERCPSLKTLLTSMELQTTGKITAEELTERIRINQAATSWPASIRCLVTLDGADLANAMVTLTPESFQGAGMSTLTGTTGQNGRADLKPANGDAMYGFYRVSISKQINGQESLLPIYNSSTILGAEIGSLTVARGGKLEFHLSSR